MGTVMNRLQICRDHYGEDAVQIDCAGGELSLSRFTETKLATFARRGWLAAQDEAMAIETKYPILWIPPESDVSVGRCRAEN